MRRKLDCSRVCARFVLDCPEVWGWSIRWQICEGAACLPPERKVLLVLDQFEQWLHAKRGEENTELVAALRHCDGEHIQAIVLVRDDFWLAASRFMRDLEIDLVPDQNIAARRSLRSSPCAESADSVRDRLRQLARAHGRHLKGSGRLSEPSDERTGSGRQDHLGSTCSVRRDGQGKVVEPGRLCERSAVRRASESPSWKRRSVPPKPTPSIACTRRRRRRFSKRSCPRAAPTSREQMRSRQELLEGIGLCEPPQGLRRPDPHPRPGASPDHADRPGRE